jgi:ABC-type branched-subunit amino acid transport system permease subunit
MKWQHILRSLALAASLPLIALSVLAAWRSVERFYTAYLITHGHLVSDDLSEGHIRVGSEIEAWCLVLGTSAVAFLLLRFWYRSKYGR